MATGDEEIGALLGRANLMRLREQWEDATALCAEILRRDPRCAAAHALLGEINEARGRPDEALHCYGMAVDLAPENAAWREKLQRLAKAKAASLRRTERAARPARERGPGWIERTFPVGANRTTLTVAVVAGGVVALGLGIGVGMLLTRPKDDLPRPLAPPANQGRKPSDPIRVATPAPRPAAAPAPAKPAPSTPTTAPAPASSSPTALAIPGAQEASFDPATGVVLVDAAMAPSDAAVAQQREEMRRTALDLARAAVQAVAQARTIQVRIGVPTAAGGTEPAFVGETRPENLRAEPPTLVSERWAARFAQP